MAVEVSLLAEFTPTNAQKFYENFCSDYESGQKAKP